LVKTKDRSTVGNLKMAEPSANPAASQTSSLLSTMTTNPWLNRFAALTLLFMMYGVGISVGRDQAVQAHHNHPACHQGLKP
jgi:hypothetical protein